MKAWQLKTCYVVLFALTLAACGGGGGGGGPAPTPVDQTISFATPGPISAAVGTPVTNTASGGAGSGSITYSSSNPTVATVNSTTGVATLNAVGSTTVTALKAASNGYNQATTAYTLNVTVGTQAIALTQAGPLQVLKGLTITNTASGGAGIGAITYASSNAAVVAVNPNSGVATGASAGTVTITATKASDTNYQQAQTTYALTVQTQAPMGAWIGANDAQVTLPAIANGAQFMRSRDRNCNLASFSACTSGQMNAVAGTSVTDTAATTSATAYYSLVSGGATNPLPVNVNRFSERIGHTALFFNNRYWVIAGGFATSASAKNDVWSSADGKTWELETLHANFGARWFHQSVVYNGKMWVIGGVSTTSNLYSDVWTSTDGVNWTSVSATLPFTTYSPENLNVTVFNNAMWAVFNGSTYSSTDGVIWMPRSAVGAIGGVIRRGYASLNVYNGKLWYIAGSVGFQSGPNNVGAAANDVWSSSDGINWIHLTPNAFSPRFRHAAFVLNNRLWVFGGQDTNSGSVGVATPDAWSTADGITWTEEATNTAIDRSNYVQVVQETNKVTLVGGVVRTISNQVLQSTDGTNWSELSSLAQFSSRLSAQAVEFLGDLWLIGGTSYDKNVTNEIWRSSDGLTWTRVTTVGPLFAPRDGHQALVFNGRLWVIGGWDDYISVGGTETRTNDVWSSADGINWTQHIPSGPIFSIRDGHRAIVFNSKLWVIGGETATDTYANDVWSTMDGVNWTQETGIADFSARSAHGAAAFNGALWVFGGGNGSALSDVWKSTNGVNWTQVIPSGASFSARFGHTVTIANNRMWLIGGENSFDYFTATRFNDVWSTVDGINWTQHTAAAQFSPRTWHTTVNHNNELWIISGYNWQRLNDVWRSTDGVNWRVGFNQNFTTP